MSNGRIAISKSHRGRPWLLLLFRCHPPNLRGIGVQRNEVWKISQRLNFVMCNLTRTRTHMALASGQDSKLRAWGRVERASNLQALTIRQGLLHGCCSCLFLPDVSSYFAQGYLAANCQHEDQKTLGLLSCRLVRTKTQISLASVQESDREIPIIMISFNKRLGNVKRTGLLRALTGPAFSCLFFFFLMSVDIIQLPKSIKIWELGSENAWFVVMQAGPYQDSNRSRIGTRI